MPKIIENARGMLVDEAKRQIEENGYDAVTVRSIAKGCSLGLGTFYNYFKSKDMLIATFLLEDWQNRIERITEKSSNESDPVALVRLMYTEINEYTQSHGKIFKSAEAKKAYNNTVNIYHKVLRNQLAEPICKSCAAREYENAEFLSQFVAESILAWSMAGTDIEIFESVIKKLFIK